MLITGNDDVDKDLWTMVSKAMPIVANSDYNDLSAVNILAIVTDCGYGNDVNRTDDYASKQKQVMVEILADLHCRCRRRYRRRRYRRRRYRNGNLA